MGHGQPTGPPHYVYGVATPLTSTNRSHMEATNDSDVAMIEVDSDFVPQDEMDINTPVTDSEEEDEVIDSGYVAPAHSHHHHHILDQEVHHEDDKTDAMEVYLEFGDNPLTYVDVEIVDPAHTPWLPDMN
eukprot:GFYU01014686.1.p1 GENE.GFYU01014686.1~~GFYU01014686.1.p1  ORF type:complete len:130 (+),score=32.21 GFYU01014686.1:597-986(+)